MGNNKIPKDWIGCPSKGDHLVDSKFVVFKTPLSKGYDRKLSSKDRFYPEDLFYNSLEKPGLWIDLTNTDRYYSKSDIEEQGCIYKKIECDGHGTFPNTKQVDKFISAVQQFLRDSPEGRIGVHCTHGFNRTGFMVVSFLVTVLKHDVTSAIESFAKARPPGIYRQTYILELLKKYGLFQSIPPAPRLPSWILNPRSAKLTNLNRSPSNPDLQSSNPREWRRLANSRTDYMSHSLRNRQHYDPYSSPPKRLDYDACTKEIRSCLSHGENQDSHTQGSDLSQSVQTRQDYDPYAKGSGPLRSPWKSFDSNAPRETDFLNDNPRPSESDSSRSSIDHSRAKSSEWPLLPRAALNHDSYPEPHFLPEGPLDSKLYPRRTDASRLSRNRVANDPYNRESDTSQNKLDNRPNNIHYPNWRTANIPLSSQDALTKGVHAEGSGPLRSPQDRLDGNTCLGVGLYRLCPQPPNTSRESARNSYARPSGTFRNEQKRS